MRDMDPSAKVIVILWVMVGVGALGGPVAMIRAIEYFFLTLTVAAVVGPLIKLWDYTHANHS